MKKVILTMFLFMGFYFAIANENQKDVNEVVNEYVTDTDAEKLIDKYSDKISAGLESLARELKQPAEFVYETLVRGQFFKGIAYSIPLPIFFIVLVFVIISFKKGDWQKSNYDTFPTNYWGIGQIVFSIFCFASLIAIFICAETAIQCLFNPHYGAIQEITSYFK